MTNATGGRQRRTTLIGLLAAAVMAAAGAVAWAQPAAASDFSQVSTMYAWGGNLEGQVGNGTTSIWVADPYALRQFDGRIVQTAAGGAFSLALLADGSVWSWGENFHGELGDGSHTDHLTPMPVANLHQIVRIAAGDGFGLAVQADGSVWAWGINDVGQLGNGSRTDAATPVKLAAPTNVVQVAAGSAHSLALRANGEVWAWGYNQSGQVGNGRDLSNQNPAGVVQPTPVRTTAPYGVVQIAAAGNQSMAMRSATLGGAVFAWGQNTFGELGNGSTDDSSTATLALRNAVTIGMGTSSSYAVGTDGFVYAWGSNQCGSLGDGTAVAERHRPERINLTGVTQLDGGLYAAAAVRSDGTLWRWGLGSVSPCAGAVGSPVQVPGLTSVAQASLGGENTFLAVAAAPTPPPPTTAIVPNLRGQTLDQAIATLQAVGLTFGSFNGIEDQSCNFIDLVISQSPQPGGEVAIGSPVSVTVGERPASTECP